MRLQRHCQINARPLRRFSGISTIPARVIRPPVWQSQDDQPRYTRTEVLRFVHQTHRTWERVIASIVGTKEYEASNGHALVALSQQQIWGNTPSNLSGNFPHPLYIDKMQKPGNLRPINGEPQAVIVDGDYTIARFNFGKVVYKYLSQMGGKKGPSLVSGLTLGVKTFGLWGSGDFYGAFQAFASSRGGLGPRTEEELQAISDHIVRDVIFSPEFNQIPGKPNEGPIASPCISRGVLTHLCDEAEAGKAIILISGSNRYYWTSLFQQIDEYAEIFFDATLAARLKRMKNDVLIIGGQPRFNAKGEVDVAPETPLPAALGKFLLVRPLLEKLEIFPWHVSAITDDMCDHPLLRFSGEAIAANILPNQILRVYQLNQNPDTPQALNASEIKVRFFDEGFDFSSEIPADPTTPDGKKALSALTKRIETIHHATIAHRMEVVELKARAYIRRLLEESRLAAAEKKAMAAQLLLEARQATQTAKEAQAALNAATPAESKPPSASSH